MFVIHSWFIKSLGRLCSTDSPSMRCHSSTVAIRWTFPSHWSTGLQILRTKQLRIYRNQYRVFVGSSIVVNQPDWFPPLKELGISWSHLWIWESQWLINGIPGRSIIASLDQSLLRWLIQPPSENPGDRFRCERILDLEPAPVLSRFGFGPRGWSNNRETMNNDDPGKHLLGIDVDWTLTSFLFFLSMHRNY